jgi:hypothetical protein
MLTTEAIEKAIEMHEGGATESAVAKGPASVPKRQELSPRRSTWVRPNVCYGKSLSPACWRRQPWH